MLDINAIYERKIEFYDKQVNIPNSVNSFNGRFDFRDHDNIPEVFHEFLIRYFAESRLHRLSLMKINELLNSIWQGPGSLKLIFMLQKELIESGRPIKFESRAKKIKDELDTLFDSDPPDADPYLFDLDLVNET